MRKKILLHLWSLLVVLVAAVGGCTQRTEDVITGSGGAASWSDGGGVASGGVSSHSGGSLGSGGAEAETGGSSGSGATGGIAEPSPRTRSLINRDWRFSHDDPAGIPNLSYAQTKAWVLPTGNAFIADPAKQAQRPVGNLGEDISYLSATFDDTAWSQVDLPHDYAIAGPYTNNISSSMARLPSPGIGWYRKHLELPAEAAEKSVFLDLDGAMQYSLVWVNGTFVGGWPYGYASYRLNLTEHIKRGEDNLIVVRVQTPTPASSSWDAGSSRWYPGAGIYRDVWLEMTESVHVAHWGTHVTTPDISETSASVQIETTLDNDGAQDAEVVVETHIFELDAAGNRLEPAVAQLQDVQISVPARGSKSATITGGIPQPKLWGVAPKQAPNMYLAVTRVRQDDEPLDSYETRFGVRSLQFDGQGFRLNGEPLKINGVCMHHDLGALGAATSRRGRERQFEILQEMGANGLRTAHNPMEPAFYDWADRMGFLVMDEAFDVWERGKAALDHHEFFQDWHEQDLRALIRRDRNHPSVFMWSIGNELVEQSDATAGPDWAERLAAICHEEDPTRPTVAGMNKAEPDSPFSGPIDTIGLNYQGTGVRDLGAQYPTYHAAFPNKFIIGTETVSTFSTRGTYLFPVASAGTPTNGSVGGDAQAGIISSYDLYHADWSYTPDEEFTSQEQWSYVGGEFVWTGFDYLGEPTPLDAVARSSYFGIVDLAGFKKDRYYLYQAHWRPEEPMAHLLPHWTWPERVGQVTPVHVYTSGDEAELFLNGESLGRKTKGQYEYRLRWDDVQYAPGELSVVAYKDGEEWARDLVETAGAATQIDLTVDRAVISADGADLAYVTARILDTEGRFVPAANSSLTFQVTGPGRVVATDNGDPTDLQVFAAPTRGAFSGMALAIVRATPDQSGEIVVSAQANGLDPGSVTIQAQ